MFWPTNLFIKNKTNHTHIQKGPNHDWLGDPQHLGTLPLPHLLTRREGSDGSRAHGSSEELYRVPSPNDNNNKMHQFLLIKSL